MNMFSCWTLPSDQDEPHRPVNEPEKKVKKRKWWQRRQKVEMQDVEGEKGNRVKGEEMGQGVEQKVLEDQADQTPKMEKQQVVMGKNKPEKKVKKRKWWQRRQKVEMQDVEGEEGNGVKCEEMGQGVEQKVLEDQADKIPMMEKQGVLGKNKPEKKVKKRKWWQRRQKVEMQDVEGEKGNEVKGEEMGQGVGQKVLVDQADQTPKMETQVVLGKNKPEKVEMQVAPRDLVEEPEQVVVKDQRRKPVDKVVLVCEIEMKKLEQVDPVEQVEEPEQVILKNQWMGHVKNKIHCIENEIKKAEGQVVQLNLVEEPELVILKEQGKGQVKNRVSFIENEMKKEERQVDPLNLVEEPELVILKEQGKGQVKNRVSFIENEMKKEERQVDPVNKTDQFVKEEERQVAPLNLVKQPDQDMKKDPAALEDKIWKLKEQNLDRGSTEDPLKNVSEVSSNKPDPQQLQDDVLVPIVEAQPEESGALMESACEDEGVPMPKSRRTSLRTKRFQFFNV
ncbi:cilia- and flagella-associated protein 251-like [Trichomycterus rosablanca]|uniref:cilia- and flagella-associated protein 251-like n=1 Tax=Trichomycterus rosablanca TaxID=2290929 RepID=UPI002F35EE49